MIPPPIEKLRKEPRCDIGGVSVFTDRPITVGLQVATRAERSHHFKGRWYGRCIVNGRQVWWMRYRMAVYYFGR